MKHLHFGVLRDDDTYRSDEAIEFAQGPEGLPPGFITDGDSFLNWGNKPLETDDDNGLYSLHVIYPYDGERPDVQDLRSSLAVWVGPGARLVDYVVESDSDDWAASQHIWTLDNVWGSNGYRV